MKGERGFLSRGAVWAQIPLTCSMGCSPGLVSAALCDPGKGLQWRGQFCRVGTLNSESGRSLRLTPSLNCAHLISTHAIGIALTPTRKMVANVEGSTTSQASASSASAASSFWDWRVGWSISPAIYVVNFRNGRVKRCRESRFVLLTRAFPLREVF